MANSSGECGWASMGNARVGTALDPRHRCRPQPLRRDAKNSTAVLRKLIG